MGAGDRESPRGSSPSVTSWGRSRKEAVPRDGALTLSDIRKPALTIACERRSRYGRYNVKRLAAAHGADARLPDLFGDARQL